MKSSLKFNRLAVACLVLGVAFLSTLGNGQSASEIIDAVPAYGSACVKKFYADAPSSANYVVAPLDNFVTCLKTVQMDAKKAVSTAFALQAAMETYSLRGYKTVTANYVNTLLDNILDTTISPPTWKRFVSEFEFLSRASNALVTAHDLHLVFVPPPLYSGSFTYRPYNFAVRLNAAGKQELYISEWNRLWTSTRAQLLLTQTVFPSWWNLAEFEASVNDAIQTGAAITAINGLDPITQWFPSIKDAFLYEDAGAAFNQGLGYNFMFPLQFLPPELAGFTHQGQTFCNSASTPCDRDPSTELLKFDNGKSFSSVKLVYITPYLNAPGECTAYSEEFSASLPYLKKGADEGRRNEGDLLGTTNPYWALRQNKQLIAKSMFPTPPPKEGSKPDEPQRIVESRRMTNRGPTPAQIGRQLKSILNDTIRTYMSNNGDLAILEILSFSPDAGVTEASVNELNDACVELLSRAVSSKTSKLLIDVTGNGGGYIFIMDVLLKLLFRGVYHTEPSSETFKTPFGQDLEVSYWPSLKAASFPTFSTPVNRKLLSAESTAGGSFTWSSVLGPMWYGGLLNLTYSTTGHLNSYPTTKAVLDETANPWYYRYRSTTADFAAPYFMTPNSASFGQTQSELEAAAVNPFTDVTILSDGRCGSACSMLQSRLSQFFPGTTFNTRTLRVVTYGGWKDASNPAMEVSQFCGGSVVQVSCIANSRNLSYNSYPGAVSKSSSSSVYYPIDVTTNVWHFYQDPTVDVRQNKPRQMQSFKGDSHLWMWEPTLDQKVAQLYPTVKFSSTASMALTTLLLSTLMLMLCFA
jgi:hypothetical protein